MHYVIIIFIIVAIIVLQTIIFISTLGKIKRFKSIFPKSVSSLKRKEETLNEINSLSDEDLQKRLRQANQKVEKFTKIIKVTSSYDHYKPDETKEVFDRNKAIVFLKGQIRDEISSTHDNKILTIIISAINDYLLNNKDAVSDFHLMKDIVDRNCDAKEEDFQTQIPIPLYFGLGGTMLGILIGVGFFVFDGGLKALLSSSNQSVSASSGIETLLGGVAIAMIASFVGIVLTTVGSYFAKFAKSATENNKHIFLTWIQAKLLPSLSSDTSSALVKMSQNLRAFNDTFSKNTGELGKTLASVNESYGLQKQLWDSVKELADKDIQQVNLELFTTLKESIGEIAKMGVYLQGVNQYQANTNDAIEKMRKFFSLGIEQIDSINIGVKNSLVRFSESTQKYLSDLQEKLDEQILNLNNATLKQQQSIQNRFNELFGGLETALKVQQDELLSHFATVSTQMQTAATEQQEIFKQKLKETAILVDELKNLSSVKNSMNELVKQAALQSQQIFQLTKAIKELAEMKVNGEVFQQRIPKWLKVYAITGGGIIVISCLLLLVFKVLSIFGVVL